LSGIKLTLGSFSGNMVLPVENAAIFTKVIHQLDNTIAEMRRVAHSMMPEALLRFGLSEAIQDYCDGINESNLVKMKFTQIGLNGTIEKPTEVVLYRIVQELSNNVIKHAAAGNIFIQLNKHEQGLTLTVEDDGKGFDITQIKKGDGLQNVQSRVDYLKGKMEIHSKTGEGSGFTIEIPT
jgi:two-component system, NarL family, sensor kinase